MLCDRNNCLLYIFLISSTCISNINRTETLFFTMQKTYILVGTQYVLITSLNKWKSYTIYTYHSRTVFPPGAPRSTRGASSRAPRENDINLNYNKKTGGSLTDRMIIIIIIV